MYSCGLQRKRKKKSFLRDMERLRMAKRPFRFEVMESLAGTSTWLARMRTKEAGQQKAAS